MRRTEADITFYFFFKEARKNISQKIVCMEKTFPSVQCRVLPVHPPWSITFWLSLYLWVSNSNSTMHACININFLAYNVYQLPKAQLLVVQHGSFSILISSYLHIIISLLLFFHCLPLVVNSIPVFTTVLRRLCYIYLSCTSNMIRLKKLNFLTVIVLSWLSVLMWYRFIIHYFIPYMVMSR